MRREDEIPEEIPPGRDGPPDEERSRKRKRRSRRRSFSPPPDDSGGSRPSRGDLNFARTLKKGRTFNRVVLQPAWVEVALLDEWGDPVPGEPFAVLSAADRTVLAEGKLDAAGTGYVLLPWQYRAGTCIVVFPRLDRADLLPERWSEATAATVLPGRPDATGWLEVRLEDEWGRPVPSEPFVVVLEDGTRVSGTLDGDGVRRLAGLAGSRCQVVFPRLDRADVLRPD